jgi:hypothetical protein
VGEEVVSVAIIEGDSLGYGGFSPGLTVAISTGVTVGG